MKKIFAFLVCGLMSLLTLTSCDDRFTYDADKVFMPCAYEVKDPSSGEEVSSTLLILGVNGLVFDEVEKSDWKIMTNSNYMFEGNQPFTLLSDKIMTIENKNQMMNIPTNYGNLSIAFGNMNVSYQYMGQDVDLEPLEGFQLKVTIEVKGEMKEPFFGQSGKVTFILMAGFCPVKVHQVDFLILEKIEENNTSQDQNQDQDQDQNQDQDQDQDEEQGQSQEGFSIEDWEETDTVNIQL